MFSLTPFSVINSLNSSLSRVLIPLLAKDVLSKFAGNIVIFHSIFIQFLKLFSQTYHVVMSHSNNNGERITLCDQHMPSVKRE